jgi:hypothetical protein
VINTLTITIIVEGMVGIGYSIWQRKPIIPIVITSIFANLITQSFLWIGLSFFFQHYLLTLSISEILIWFLEGILLHVVRANKLNFKESLFLSLIMNAASFGVGWLLPV